MEACIKNRLDWLMDGDASVRWQVMRDLTNMLPPAWKKEREKVATEGFGRRILDRQDPEGTWAKNLYSPKWTSTTYTLLQLRRLGLPPDNALAARGCRVLLKNNRANDGGINYWGRNNSETCVTGMTLSLFSYFRCEKSYSDALVEHLQSVRMSDGAWNCQWEKGATHSSFHTTISVLEGLYEYEKAYGEDFTREWRLEAVEFLLNHKLYKSHRTGKVFDPRMTRSAFPPRWHYDILRILDHLQEAEIPYDKRMDEALDLLAGKKDQSGRWPLDNVWNGKIWFTMETPGKPSRFNTLRALRVMRRYLPGNG